METHDAWGRGVSKEGYSVQKQAASASFLKDKPLCPRGPSHRLVHSHSQRVCYPKLGRLLCVKLGEHVAGGAAVDGHDGDNERQQDDARQVEDGADLGGGGVCSGQGRGALALARDEVRCAAGGVARLARTCVMIVRKTPAGLGRGGAGGGWGGGVGWRGAGWPRGRGARTWVRICGCRPSRRMGCSLYPDGAVHVLRRCWRPRPGLAPPPLTAEDAKVGVLADHHGFAVQAGGHVYHGADEVGGQRTHGAHRRDLACGRQAKAPFAGGAQAAKAARSQTRALLGAVCAPSGRRRAPTAPSRLSHPVTQQAQGPMRSPASFAFLGGSSGGEGVPQPGSGRRAARALC